ncbi:MAG: hypothetical protein AAFR61_28965 [Bacteroidota bacterium]
MEITRIFTDNQGDSHFEEIPVLMEDQTEIGYFSRPERKVSQMYFQNALPHHYWEFHSVEDKIQLVLIKGKLEFITSDGIRKTFRSGDVILLDDHSGKGHSLRSFEETTTVLATHYQ